MQRLHIKKLFINLVEAVKSGTWKQNTIDASWPVIAQHKGIVMLGFIHDLPKQHVKSTTPKRPFILTSRESC